MNNAKLRLSEDELMLMQRADWILTKNGIIHKVCDLFGALSESMKPILQEKLLMPPGIEQRAKISKGENYQGLPYVVLDYPREFKQEDILAIRSLFWWGNYFSITLHLKGDHKAQFHQSILANQEILARHHFHIYQGNEEWAHEFSSHQYQALHSIDNSTFESIIGEKPFLKISAVLHFGEWKQAETWFLKQFGVLLVCLKP